MEPSQDILFLRDKGYKIHEENKQVIVYAVVDQRQDYLNIIRGL